MYKVEIFDRDFRFASHGFSEIETIFFDYLTLEKTSFSIPGTIEVDRGYFVHITEESQNVYQGIVSDFSRGNTTDIQVEPLQSLLNIAVYFDRNRLDQVSLESFIGEIIASQYKNNADTLQNIPNIRIETPTSTTGAKLNLKDNVHNLYDLILSAFEQYGIVVSARIDFSPIELVYTIHKVGGTPIVIESDSIGVLESNFSIRDTYGTLNKITIINKEDEAQQETFYLNNNGEVTQDDTDRITPVFFSYQYIEYTDGEETFLQKAEEAAKSALVPQEFDNLIEITAKNDSKIIPISSISIGNAASIRRDGDIFSSVLTGYERSKFVTKLIFGAVRIELTKLLIMERRNKQ